MVCAIEVSLSDCTLQSLISVISAESHLIQRGLVFQISSTSAIADCHNVRDFDFPIIHSTDTPRLDSTALCIPYHSIAGPSRLRAHHSHQIPPRLLARPYSSGILYLSTRTWKDASCQLADQSAYSPRTRHRSISVCGIRQCEVSIRMRRRDTEGVRTKGSEYERPDGGVFT